MLPILSISSWNGLSMALLMGAVVAVAGTNVACYGADESPFRALSDAEAWEHLPKAVKGSGQALPVWARILAEDVPHTTAALLQLDLAHRTKSPVPPGLRAAMRWVGAHANRCAYAEAYAAADARRAGVSNAQLEGLAQPGYPGWSAAERAALEFARKMTIASDSVTDEEFAALVRDFGEKQTASMVLLMAWANFQDRYLLCLSAQVEPGGPLAPAELVFSPEAFLLQTASRSPHVKTPIPKPTGKDDVEDDPEWAQVSYPTLQQGLEAQRSRPTRLRIPEWDEIAGNIPEGLFSRPNDIVWIRVAFGYAPELATPFEVYLRTTGPENSAKWDRVMGLGLFWITTRGVKCPYCMGHVEMNWEVVGLDKEEIAERSRLLAGDDWSSFSSADQRAYAFARKLSRSPPEVSQKDIAELCRDFGAERVKPILLNASRYHYMTRVSNGFQLTLERRNVFMEDPKPAK